MKKTTTEYFYNDNNLDRVVTTETIERADCGNEDEGELLTSEVEVVSENTETLAMAALILSAIGLGVSIARLLRNK